jgi:hypothetical protein
MSTPHADAHPPGQAAVDQGVDSVDFDLAVLGRGLPPQVEAWLAEAGRLGPHDPKAAVLIQQARQAAPNHPATLIALYRCHFYGHRLNEALDVAQDALALARSALQPPVQDDPGALPLITDDQARFDAAARFYLFTLKGYAYLHLRLGQIESGKLALTTLRQLDPQDRVGGAVLLTVLSRAEREAAQLDDDDTDADELARRQGRKPHRGWSTAP